MEEGIEKEKLSIAKNMLKNNLLIEDIIKYTNLTKEQSLGLKSEK